MLLSNPQDKGGGEEGAVSLVIIVLNLSETRNSESLARLPDEDENMQQTNTKTNKYTNE